VEVQDRVEANLVELEDRLHEVKDIVAAFKESVKADEERAVLKAPGI
jgi:hypothetical protein